MSIHLSVRCAADPAVGSSVRHGLFNPLLHRIKVSRAERRRDLALLMLRQAEAEYDTICEQWKISGDPQQTPSLVRAAEGYREAEQAYERAAVALGRAVDC